MSRFKNFLNQISPLSDSEFEIAIPYLTTKKLKKGDHFVREGEVCRYIAYILKGCLRVYYINDKSEETTSCFCTEDHLTTSYKSFVLQEPSTLVIQALEDTEVQVIHYKDLQHLYATSSVWQTIGRVISEREYIVMERYASILSNESAKEKYLRLLEEQPHVMHIAKVEDIASYLGITRRTLSRIRQEITKA